MNLFTDFHAAHFGARRGAASLVTFKDEGKKNQITCAGDEQELLESHFGKGGIWKGAKKLNPSAAVKEFFLENTGSPTEVTLVYPTPETKPNQLRFYMSKQSGFIAPAGHVWFVFEPSVPDGWLHIGYMDMRSWEGIRLEQAGADADDGEYQRVFRLGPAGAKVPLSGMREPRSMTVAANAAYAAGYACEIDPAHGTFIAAASGRPFIEVHHLMPMHRQDEFRPVPLDQEANVVALCPGCHRVIHHAEAGARKGLLEQLFAARKDRLAVAGLGFSLEKLLAVYGVGTA